MAGGLLFDPANGSKDLTCLHNKNGHDSEPGSRNACIIIYIEVKRSGEKVIEDP